MDLRVKLGRLACRDFQVPMVCRDIQVLKDHPDQKETEVPLECEDHKVTQAFPDQRGIEENADLRERRAKRGFRDILAQKETRAQREKMVPQETRVPKESKDLKVLRVEAVSQAHPVLPDLQDQRGKGVPLECRVTRENRERREILELLDQEDETDLRELGEIQDLQDHKDQEERGVRVASVAPPEHLVHQEQREALVNLASLEIAETRDLQAPRVIADRQELVDQWVCQENQDYQDILGLVERRECKENPGRQVHLVCQVVGVLQENEVAQDPKETVVDRVHRDHQAIQESRVKMVPRESQVNQA